MKSKQKKDSSSATTTYSDLKPFSSREHNEVYRQSPFDKIIISKDQSIKVDKSLKTSQDLKPPCITINLSLSSPKTSSQENKKLSLNSDRNLNSYNIHSRHKSSNVETLIKEKLFSKVNSPIAHEASLSQVKANKINRPHSLKEEELILSVGNSPKHTGHLERDMTKSMTSFKFNNQPAKEIVSYQLENKIVSRNKNPPKEIKIEANQNSQLSNKVVSYNISNKSNVSLRRSSDFVKTNSFNNKTSAKPAETAPISKKPSFDIVSSEHLRQYNNYLLADAPDLTTKVNLTRSAVNSSNNNSTLQTKKKTEKQPPPKRSEQQALLKKRLEPANDFHTHPINRSQSTNTLSFKIAKTDKSSIKEDKSTTKEALNNSRIRNRPNIPGLSLENVGLKTHRVDTDKSINSGHSFEQMAIKTHRVETSKDNPLSSYRGTGNMLKTTYFQPIEDTTLSEFINTTKKDSKPVPDSIPLFSMNLPIDTNENHALVDTPKQVSFSSQKISTIIPNRKITDSFTSKMKKCNELIDNLDVQFSNLEKEERQRSSSQIKARNTSLTKRDFKERGPIDNEFRAIKSARDRSEGSKSSKKVRSTKLSTLDDSSGKSMTSRIKSYLPKSSKDLIHEENLSSTGDSLTLGKSKKSILKKYFGEKFGPKRERGQSFPEQYFNTFSKLDELLKTLKDDKIEKSDEVVKEKPLQTTTSLEEQLFTNNLTHHNDEHLANLSNFRKSLAKILITRNENVK